MKALIFVEQEDGVAHHSAARLVTAASKLASEIHAVVIGKNAGKAASSIALISGVKTVYTQEDSALHFPLAESVAALLHAHFTGYDYYLATSTSTGKDCMPRFAALLDVAQLSDVIEILDKDTFKRPIYAGNAIETVKSTDKQKVITLRASSFAPAAGGGAAAIETIAAENKNTLTECIAFEQTKGTRPDLTAARVIVSGGRGVGSAENFKHLERIADKLSGAVGASRAAVDAGYVPNDYQIGQTGKIVAPELYIALGISGAIQHLAGIKDSKIIVAINKDENAPIFEVADYGLVADIFQALPELEALLLICFPVNLTLAQIGTTVGDIDGNIARIKTIAAQHPKDSIVVFPEMAITGYPPEDLILRPAFQHAAMQAVEQLAKDTANLPPIIVGGLWMEEDRRYNTAFFLSGGQIVHKHYKAMLPNYGVFDERRIFNPGSSPVVFTHHGKKIGVLVCEEIWHPHLPRLLKAQAADCAIVINASPFEKGKLALRHQLVSETSKSLQLPIAYLNTCGAQDDIIFDGGSFACDANGKIVFSLPQFEEVIFPINSSHRRGEVGRGALLDSGLECPHPNPSPTGEGICEEMWKAAVSGLKAYVSRNGFKGVVLGMSGGIDSAMVAAMAVDALGADKVMGVMLPSEFTSRESTEDAQESAKLLGIKLLNIPITAAMQAAGSELIPALRVSGNWQSDLSLGGNLQARLRGIYLMAVSNAQGLMLINTSNKSEIAVGYSTLYGDSCGGYAPLKDVYKTEIYKLAKWRNGISKVIPDRSISKVPTAELAPGQTDQDQLPPYDVLDAILQHYIEGQKSIDDIVKSGYAKPEVERIVRMIRTSEYKRRQAPPGAKISSMEFIRDWRMPLTNGFKG